MPHSFPFEGIVAIVVIAMLLVACLALERLVHKRNRQSAKFFWRATVVGAVIGALLTVSLVVTDAKSDLTHFSLMYLPLILFNGAAMGLVPGAIIGLIIGWFYKPSS